MCLEPWRLDVSYYPGAVGSHLTQVPGNLILRPLMFLIGTSVHRWGKRSMPTPWGAFRSGVTQRMRPGRLGEAEERQNECSYQWGIHAAVPMPKQCLSTVFFFLTPARNRKLCSGSVFGCDSFPVCGGETGWVSLSVGLGPHPKYPKSEVERMVPAGGSFKTSAFWVSDGSWRWRSRSLLGCVVFCGLPHSLWSSLL